MIKKALAIWFVAMSGLLAAICWVFFIVSHFHLNCWSLFGLLGGCCTIVFLTMSVCIYIGERKQ